MSDELDADGRQGRSQRTRDPGAALALALVDACETAPLPVEPLAEGGASHSSSSELERSKPKREASAVQMEKTGRKRLRVEILRLRSEVVDLESRVSQLRRHCGDHGDSREARQTTRAIPSADTEAQESAPAKPTIGWFAKSVAEYEKLGKAKQKNLDLKDAIDAQMRTSASLERLFQLKLSKQDLAFLSEIKKQNAPGHPTPDSTPEDEQAAGLSALMVHLEQLYSITQEIVAQIATKNTRRVFSMAYAEQDPELGPSHEFTTNTPLSCDYRQLEQFLWQQIGVNANMDCRMPSHRLLTMPRRHLSIAFSEQVGGRNMDGVFVVRRFVEPHRVVFALTSRLSFSRSALAIREDAWVVLTNLKASTSSNGGGGASASSTLMQTHHRMRTETRDPTVTREMQQLEHIVLRFQTEKMQSYLLSLQSVLLHDQNAVYSDNYQLELNFECVACGFHASGLREGDQAVPGCGAQ